MLKNRVDELAIFGGTPAFSEYLHVGRPNIPDRERFSARVNDLFDRAWFTNDGPYVQELERRITDLLRVKHCVATCNGTIALEIVLRALEISGEVILPSFTFIATAHAVQWQGITPVFADINPLTHNLDSGSVEQLINDRTSAILGVHTWGKPCSPQTFADIAAEHRLELLFDAAHAFCCSSNGRMIGSFGDAEIFSFHATKFFHTFEGGAVTTNDDQLARKIRSMRNFGYSGLDFVTGLGTNGKMTEISAAMGLTCLESLNEFIAINHKNYTTYHQQLDGVPGLTMITYDPREQNNYQYIVLEIDGSKTQLERDQLKEILQAENVLARRYFFPGCHDMEPYKSLYPDADLALPQTERVAARVLTLPTGQAIDSEKIDAICNIIRTSLAHADEIKHRWEKKSSSVGV